MVGSRWFVSRYKKKKKMVLVEMIRGVARDFCFSVRFLGFLVSCLGLFRMVLGAG